MLTAHQSVCKGQTVSFIYEKGSVPGSRRVLEVQQNDGVYLGGTDLLANPPSHKQFTISDIRRGEIALIADENEEVFSLPSFIPKGVGNVDGPTALAVYKLLYPKRVGARYDSLTDSIVVRKERSPSIEVVIDKNETRVNFVNEDGKVLTYTILVQVPGDSVEVGTSITCQQNSDQLNKFVLLLVDHFKYSSTSVHRPYAHAGVGSK